MEEDGQSLGENDQPITESQPVEGGQLTGAETRPRAIEANRLAGEPGGAEGDQEGAEEARQEAAAAAQEREEELAAMEPAMEPAP